MLLLSVCILASLLFVFCVRKHKKILSALIAIEALILTFMLAVTYLSAAGNEDIYVYILARAISGKVTIFGVSVSSLIAIQAVVVLLACLISLYGIYRVVKKVMQSKRAAYIRSRVVKVLAAIPRCITQRKVFKLYCRMNN